MTPTRSLADSKPAIASSSAVIGLVGSRRLRGHVAEPFQDWPSLDRLPADPSRLAQRVDRLAERAEAFRPVGGGDERDPRLRPDGITLRSVGCGVIGGDEVGCDGAGELLIVEGPEVAGRREVSGPTFAPRQRRVGDLADERLHEGMLAPRRRSRVGLDREDLAPYQRIEPRRERVRRLPGHRREGRHRERLAEDRRVLEQPPVRR